MSCLSPRPQHTCQKCSGALPRGTYSSGNTGPPRTYDEDDDDDDDGDEGDDNDDERGDNYGDDDDDGDDDADDDDGGTFLSMRSDDVKCTLNANSINTKKRSKQIYVSFDISRN